MICAGITFDDGSLDWDDLYAFIFAAPPGTAVFHAFEKGWDTNSHLLAHVIDRLNINNWQRTEGATKKPPRGMPEPFPRPGDDQKNATPEIGDVVSVGDAVATVTTVGEFMAKRAERERRWREKHNKKKGGG
jgi:hypothetical protein